LNFEPSEVLGRRIFSTSLRYIITYDGFDNAWRNQGIGCQRAGPVCCSGNEGNFSSCRWETNTHELVDFPTLAQVMSVKAVPPNRIQITITDGVESGQAMLASQVSSADIAENTLLRISKYISSELAGKK
jgi:hypothetical protein